MYVCVNIFLLKYRGCVIRTIPKEPAWLASPRGDNAFVALHLSSCLKSLLLPCQHTSYHCCKLLCWLKRYWVIFQLVNKIFFMLFNTFFLYHCIAPDIRAKGRYQLRLCIPCCFLFTIFVISLCLWLNSWLEFLKKR